MKFLNCKNIINYTNRYQIVFDKIFSLINEKKDFWISKKFIEITFQKNFLKHFGRNYFVLVLAIKTMWKEKITNLANTILKIIRYAKIKKENKKNIANNINIFIIDIQ